MTPRIRKLLCVVALSLAFAGSAAVETPAPAAAQPEIIEYVEAAASHQPADVVCEYYKPHTGDVRTAWYWDSGQRRYECAYQHPGTLPPPDHYICVYPPEHWSPPDNVWAKINGCTF